MRQGERSAVGILGELTSMQGLDGPMVVRVHGGERRELLRGHRHRVQEDLPLHALRARWCRQRSGVLDPRGSRGDHMRKVDRRRQGRRRRLRHLDGDPREQLCKLLIARARVQEHAEDQCLPVLALVHEVELGVEACAVDKMLAARMEMELLQVVRHATHSDRVRGQVLRDRLDGVPVVLHGEDGRLVRDVHGRTRVNDKGVPADVDRRLDGVGTISAERVARAPVLTLRVGRG
ncbi:hypothetical protein ABE10_25540 [Bacillus toyonensis]|nr:hypothetical protein [Bacillus toyonensis]